MICQRCNHESKTGAKFCGNCGGTLMASATPVKDEGVRGVGNARQGQTIKADLPPENQALSEKHIVAPALSLLVPGGGQLYLNDAQKGFVLLAIAVALGSWLGSYAWFAVALWAAYDAYQVATGRSR